MEHLPTNFSSRSFISTLKRPHLLQRTASFSSTGSFSASKCTSGVHSMVRPFMGGESFSYKKFIHFALEETNKYTDLKPSILQENFSGLKAVDGKAQLQMLAFESPKIRLLRSLSIEGSDGMQLFPWGGKITPESLKFFSPIVIWTKFSPCQDKHHALYSAFKDYLTSWLKLMEQASGETEIPQIIINLEWQHRYLTWRAEKDPGHQLLRRLIGETLAKEIIKSFLFNGVDDMGNKTFLDYFPEYKCDDGTINQKRSMIGKSFESRPWDARGEFINNT